MNKKFLTVTQLSVDLETKLSGGTEESDLEKDITLAELASTKAIGTYVLLATQDSNKVEFQLYKYNLNPRQPQFTAMANTRTVRHHGKPRQKEGHAKYLGEPGNNLVLVVKNELDKYLDIRCFQGLTLVYDGRSFNRVLIGLQEDYNVRDTPEVMKYKISHRKRGNVIRVAVPKQSYRIAPPLAPEPAEEIVSEQLQSDLAVGVNQTTFVPQIPATSAPRQDSEDQQPPPSESERVYNLNFFAELIGEPYESARTKASQVGLTIKIDTGNPNDNARISSRTLDEMFRDYTWEDQRIVHKNSGEEMLPASDVARELNWKVDTTQYQFRSGWLRDHTVNVSSKPEYAVICVPKSIVEREKQRIQTPLPGT